jgi:hypothetical protein
VFATFRATELETKNPKLETRISMSVLIVGFTGLKKLAATAAWLAEPPSNRGFSACGVLIESNAVEPTINTLMQIQ